MAALALTACTASDPAIVDPPPVRPDTTATTVVPPRALAVLGQGVVTMRYTGEVTVRARGDYAYTSTWGRRLGTVPGNVVHVWDVRGDRPLLADTVVLDGITTTGDVQVSDDDRLLVVATEPVGSLAVYALDDPARPRLLRRYASPALAPGVHTAQVARVDGTLYVFACVNPGAGTPSRLVIVDLSDPANPREAWSGAMGRPFVHDVFVRDGVLMTANWDEGLVVWDLGGLRRGGSPAAPVRVGAIRTVASGGAGASPSVHNVWWLHQGGGKRFVLVGEELTTGSTIGNWSGGDLHVVDVGDLSDSTRWREVATFRVPGAGVHNFSVDEATGVLYAAYYGGGVRALDVRGDLATCPAAQRTADGRCDLARMGRAIGVALDTGPTTLEPRTGIAHEPFVWGVEFLAGHVYASDMMGGLWKLRGLTP